MGEASLTTRYARLPERPDPVQVEIEFTSACNAKCTACPRGDMPVAGLLREETLERIIAVYREVRSALAINRLTGGDGFPSVTIAGGGEPTLHPRAGEYVRRLVGAGFKTHLITNGSRMSRELAADVARSGVSSISVSFWGIKKDEYESAMRLPFEATLARVLGLFDACAGAGVPVQIVWVRSPEITSSDQEIKAFWDARGVPVDLSDTLPWNRGGLKGPPLHADSPPGQFLPDPSKRIWCSDLFFSDSYRWNGDYILCCCNFFKRSPLKLGNIHENSFQEIVGEKTRLLERRPLPAMCQVCELPRANRARWLAAPWLERISPEEREMLLGPTAVDH